MQACELATMRGTLVDCLPSTSYLPTPASRQPKPSHLHCHGRVHRISRIQAALSDEHTAAHRIPSPDSHQLVASASKRALLVHAALAAAGAAAAKPAPAWAISPGADQQTLPASASPSDARAAAAPKAPSRSKCEKQYGQYLSGPPDWTRPGPLQVVHLPRLEHTCVTCFPACVGTSCLVRADIAYPKGGNALGLGPPYPLAIFSSGFLVSSDSYRSYADALASWGWTVMLYDRQETVADLLDDVACVTVIRDLISWCARDPLLRRIADTRAVFLAGHSRGGKLSALAAAADPRVAAACLIDAVDNTVYAPLAPGYPSAVEALRRVPRKVRALPVAVVGGGQGGDCAPEDANYAKFFAANRGPTWEVDIGDAGHFQFLDQRSPLQRAVCPEGGVSEDAVRRVSQAVMVAWAETMVRQRGIDVTGRGLPPYPHACQKAPDAAAPRALGVNGVGAPAPGPTLPTWGSPMPQFNEDTLGPKKSAWQLDGGAPADLAAQRAAAGLRQRLNASLEASSAEEGEFHACPAAVDASLQEVLGGMLDQVKGQLQLQQVRSRYKNFA